MIYLSSKELSRKLRINLAKWKRWTREFLEPDPLGGYQSGYARQFSHRDAFRVYLGGYLVGQLKFSILDAGRILSDLNAWLNKNGFYVWAQQVQSPPKKNHHIYVYRSNDGALGYVIRSISNTDHQINKSDKDRYAIELINISSNTATAHEYPHAHVIYINTLHQIFLKKISNS